MRERKMLREGNIYGRKTAKEGVFTEVPRTNGDAHGHGPYPITNGERVLLSAWLKQGRDWLML